MLAISFRDADYMRFVLLASCLHQTKPRVPLRPWSQRDHRLCVRISFQSVFHELYILLLTCALHTKQGRYGRMFQRRALGRVTPCTRAIPSTLKTSLASLFKTRRSAELRMSGRTRSSRVLASSGPGRNDGRRPPIRYLPGIFRHIWPVLVTNPVSGQCQQSDQADGACRHEAGTGQRGSPLPPVANRGPTSCAWGRGDRTGWPR